MSARLFSLAASATALWAFAAPSPATAQSAPSDHTYATLYNLQGQVTGTIAPDPDGAGALKFGAVRNTYNAQGFLTKVEKGELAAWQSHDVEPKLWSGFTVLSSAEIVYDPMGLKLRETVKGSDGVATALTQYSYTAAGKLECTAVRMNPAAYGSLPASACTLGAQGSHGPDRITRNVYKLSGLVEKVQKAVGTSLQQDYVTYSYTVNGKQASVTDANGTKAAYAYDAHDRLLRWNFPSKATAGEANPADYEEYGYDANDNRTILRKRDGSTLTYQYDALNRNTVKIVPERAGLSSTHTRDVYYGYDLRGLQLYARFDHAAGEGITTTYDNLGRPSSSTAMFDGVARMLQYGFDGNGNRNELTQPGVATTTFGHDGLDRMASILEGPWINVATFGYDARGQRASLARTSGGATSYGYDPVGRLSNLTDDLAGTSADTTSTFSYNPASQIVGRTRSNDSYVFSDVARTQRYTVNGLNQYATVGASPYGYDANGNLTSDGATTYVYDVENRLVSASGAVNAALRYDPLGRLYETVGGVMTRFLYDGDELVAEYDGAGTLLKRYVHGAGVDDPLLWYEGGVRRQLYTDHQGSIISVADASGNPIQVNRYDDWGVPQSGNAGRFQYTGQAWLPELGMYYYKARIYSPMLGRFMQTDPIGYEDQQNLYTYVGNDPINMADPSGEAGLVIDGCGGEKGSVSSSCAGTQGVLSQDSGQRENSSSEDFQRRGRSSSPMTAGGPLQSAINARYSVLSAQIKILAPGHASVRSGDRPPSIQTVGTMHQQRQQILNSWASSSGRQDRNSFTLGGRSFQKHSSRGDFSAPQNTSASGYNQAASNLMSSIINNPGVSISVTQHSNLVVVTAPGIGSAHFTRNGNFVYFSNRGQ